MKNMLAFFISSGGFLFTLSVATTDTSSFNREIAWFFIGAFSVILINIFLEWLDIWFGEGETDTEEEPVTQLKKFL